MFTPRTRNGWIAMIVVSVGLSLAFRLMTPSGDSATGVGAILKSGPFICTITDVQQTAEGTVVSAKIVNSSERIVESATAILTAKDADGMSLNSDEETIGDDMLNGLAPGGVVEQQFLLYDVSQVNIARFAFRSSAVMYAGS
ncbi:MAG: hypothetical protein D6800_07465 [Candidatus Zixiibacteriota bacterium]|nr:MAG: hypothetical protein D6800_07465 [candidate division Zixibacteria bacterium]